MPWTAKDAKRHCKECDPSKWASIANAVLKRCQDSGGSDCEGRAVRIANSRAKQKEELEALIQKALDDLDTELEGGDNLTIEEYKEELKQRIQEDPMLTDDERQELLSALDSEQWEDIEDLEEFEMYALGLVGAAESWTAPSKRKNLPASHFFWPEKKKYPYRNSDGSINCAGVFAAWRMAHGARSGQKAPSFVISRIKPKYESCKRKREKKKENEFSADDGYKLVTFQEEPVQLQYDDEGKSFSDVQMLRSGKWEHPLFGTININSDTFKSFIKNFKAGIPYGQFAMDYRHMPERGAAGWIQKVYTAGNNGNELWYRVEWTPRGEESIKNKEFIFSSIEYHDNYKDAESGKTFGPTILGGALTNRPFIKGMKPIAMSEDGETLLEFKQVYGASKDPENPGEGGPDVMKTLEEIKQDIERMSGEIKDLQKKLEADPENKDLKKQFEQLQASIAESQAELKKAEKSQGEGKKSFDELKAEKDELERKFNELSDQFKNLLTERKQEKVEAYRSRIKAKISEFKDIGVPPALLQVVEPILLADDAPKITVTLTDSEGKEDKMTLLNVVAKIFEALPEEAKVDTSQKTKEGRKTSEFDDKVDIDDVEKYSKEKGLSFADALVELNKQGKIYKDE